jgi:hypothetical protein
VYLLIRTNLDTGRLNNFIISVCVLQSLTIKSLFQTMHFKLKIFFVFEYFVPFLLSPIWHGRAWLATETSRTTQRRWHNSQVNPRPNLFALARY